MEQNENIAKKLRMLRAEFNYTQADVANKLGISQQTYSKYEAAKINIDSNVIIQICDLYGISSDYLLGIEKDRQSVAADGGKKAAKKKPGAETVAYKTDADIEKIVKKVLSEINGK